MSGHRGVVRTVFGQTGDPQGVRQRPNRVGAGARVLVATTAALLLLAACADDRTAGVLGQVEGFSGLVAADEPQAVLIGRDVLALGGLATDAAVAMGFALSVTLPSSAGLGGGGVCLVADAEPPTGPDRTADTVQALEFLPDPTTGPGQAMGVPALARGLFALHARYGSLRWESLVMPAETLARFGAPVSRALARRVPAGPARPARFPPTLAEGDRLVHHDLAAVLGRLRQWGAGDLHDGLLAREMLAAAQTAGLALTIEDLRRELPRWGSADTTPRGNETVYRIARGGEPASPSATTGGTAGEGGTGSGGDGTTGFVVADRLGNAVSCVLTLGRPFGLGQEMPGQGFFVAAPEAGTTAGPDLAALVMVNRHVREFHLALAAGGFGARSLMDQVTGPLLADSLSDPTPALGAVVGRVTAGADGGAGTGTAGAAARINGAFCAEGIPPRPETCAVVTDPRGAGYGLRVGL